MPNNVRIVMTVVGKNSLVADFVKRARGKSPQYVPSFMDDKVEEPEELPLQFHNFVPIPDGLLARTYGAEQEGRAAVKAHTDLSRFDGCESGYEWEYKHWGCKWGAYDQHSGPVLEPGKATYRFTCAWGPPITFVEKVTKMYLGLTFIVSYGGEGPCLGRFVAASGQVFPKDDGSDVDFPNYPEDMTDEQEDAVYAQYKRAEQTFVDSHDEYVKAFMAMKEVENQ